MSRLVELVAPARLGTSFRWLLASGFVLNLGDGIALAAGPLLVATLTRDPLLVAGATFAEWAPPFLFGLLAGVASDRLDRRAIVIGVNVVRVGVLVVLTLTVLAGVATAPIVLGCLFLLGSAEVFADNTSGTLIPLLVRREDLALANARATFNFVTLNQLVGVPVGAALFALGAAWPFATQAVLVAAGVLLFGRVVLPAATGQAAPAPVLGDIAAGFRWVWHHAAVRTLVLTILFFNITFGAAWSVLVLYATRTLHMSPVGYGLMTTFSAVGGIVGTAAYGRITRHISLGNLMRLGLVFETFMHLAFALNRSQVAAYALMTAFGAHAFIWHTTSTTVRQRAVPHEFMGRVGSVNVLGVYGGLVVGSALGGVIAQRWEVTGPFWFAFAGSAVFVVLLWRQLSHVAHADEALDA